MTSVPLVSVIVPYQQRMGSFSESLKALFQQSYPGWELLLVNMDSRSNCFALATQWAKVHGGRVRYLEQDSQNGRGVSSARNLGLRNANGKYVAFLETLHSWPPDKLERQMAVCIEEPRAQIVIGSWHSRMPQLHQTAEGKKDDHFGPTMKRNHRYDSGALAPMCFSPTSGFIPDLSDALIDRKSIEAIQGFDEDFADLYETFADRFFWCKVLLKHGAYVSGGACVGPSGSQEIQGPIPGSPAFHRASMYFLNRLGTYLIENDLTSPSLWGAFLDAASSYKLEPTCALPAFDGQHVKWTFRLAGGNQAKLIFPSVSEDIARVEIARTESKVGYDIQLNQPFLTVQAGRRYRLRFRGRADSPRRIFVGLAKSEAPWTGLGLYAQIPLTTDWKTFEEEFTAQSDEDNARILFDVGEESPSIAIASLVLEDRTDGHHVLPNLSRHFPIDRYHIDRFFARYAEDLRGRVLEAGGDGFTDRYRGHNHPLAIEKRWTHPERWEPDTFDCVILPHCLQTLLDVKTYVEEIHRILKPGGVVLVTLPGILVKSDPEWGAKWIWSFTPLSAQKMFETVFGEGHVVSLAFGNVPALISLSNELSRQVLEEREIDLYEAGYEVLITIRAVKAAPFSG
jgi:glycosyltransferase involved in cell wall biosynthesis/SAM-dependent methyltransferase